MSAINIKIISVENSQVPTAKGSYGVAEVTYKNLSFQDKVEAKKVMSFTHKDVYNTLKSAQSGDLFTVQRMKNDKGFWDWISLGEGDAPQAAPATQGATMKPAASPKSSFETPEERAAKQVYIVRQSSISSAIETLKTDKKVPTVEEVLAVAKQYEAYVFGKEEQPVPELPVDLDEDVPY